MKITLKACQDIERAAGLVNGKAPVLALKLIRFAEKLRFESFFDTDEETKVELRDCVSLHQASILLRKRHPLLSHRLDVLFEEMRRGSF